MTHIFVWRFEDVVVLVAMALFLVFAAVVLANDWWKKRKGKK